MTSRRTRTATRPASKTTAEAVPDKDETTEEKFKYKQASTSDMRRKISMLGPMWNDEELKLFYQAYRKHGKSWKKVAGSLHTRTSEMVEALYTVNKAYLSLPEGAASAEGLIAMMTDHYNILDESKSDGVESSGDFGGSEHQNQSRLRSRVGQVGSGATSGALHGAASYGGPSSAKKPRTSRTRPVGKRTPRFPSSNHAEKQAAENVAHAAHREGDLDTDEDGDDSRVAKVVALTLATASQRAASPQISHTPTTKTPRKQMQGLAVLNGETKERTESGGSVPRQAPSTSGEGGNAESHLSKEVENGVVAKASSSFEAGDGRPCSASRRNTNDSKVRGRKPVGKRLKMVHRIEDLDEKEECSRTDGKTSHDEDNGDVLDTEEAKLTQSQRKKRAPAQRPKKRSRQLFAGDESSGLDRLATLADLSIQSLNGSLPSPTFDSDGPQDDLRDEGMLEKQQSVTRDPDLKDDVRYHPPVPRSDSTGGEVYVKPRVQELSRESGGTGSEQQVQQQEQLTFPPGSKKRKRKLAASQKPDDMAKQGTPEVRGEVVPQPMKDVPIVMKPRYKARRAPSNRAPPKQVSRIGKQLVSEHDSSPVLEPSVEESTLPPKLRNKKKGVPEKYTVSEENGSALELSLHSTRREEAHCPHSTPELGPQSTKARLTHCLSTKFRRWCMCEWFYSAIDLPWFARNEFVEYLNHAGLGHVPKLTRVEWGVIRSSLGKPRRLSKKFLEEEREKLEKYREKARNHYHELRSGLRDGLPPDLARPLTVGQRVIARHTRTRQIHDGSVLTVDRSRCRVQFDRPELGVELVMDIDCMPVHPLENMPEVMRRRRVIVDGIDRNFEESRGDYKSKIYLTAGGAARAALNERLERPCSLPAFVPQSHVSFNTLSKRAQADSVDSVALAKAQANEAAAVVQQAVLSQSHTAAQLQAKEADVQALAELTRVLDQKEALLVELRRITDEAAGGKLCEPLKMQCAAVVLQLTEANKQVQTALQQLRRRNKYQDNIVAPWAQLTPQAVVPANASGSESPETGPSVEDIAASAKKHARFMISTTVQAMSSLVEGDDTLSKLGTLDFVPEEAAAKGGETVLQIVAGDSETTSTPAPPLFSTTQAGSGGAAATSQSQNQGQSLKPCTKSHEKEGGGADTNGVKQPISELMASCVATLLLVQATTERQLPSAEVAVALDKSLVGLRPQAAQNHHIFREIERILGTVKGQIASQVPQAATPHAVAADASSAR